jgi:hypothetical protein
MLQKAQSLNDPMVQVHELGFGELIDVNLHPVLQLSIGAGPANRQNSTDCLETLDACHVSQHYSKVSSNAGGKDATATSNSCARSDVSRHPAG